MSGQWEVVGRKKDKSNKNTQLKLTQNIKKKNLNDVNVDEILPKSQLKNLYNNEKSSKENKPKNPEKASQESVKKVVQKKDKPQELPKTKAPKSIESALNAINSEEFKNVYETSKIRFPDAPIVWLKELAQFLNVKVPVEVSDPVFTGRNPGYPFNVVPSGVKGVIEKAVKEAGKANGQLFFDIALTSMATDMSKGLPGLGYKFFLQYMALNEPTLAINSLNKHVVLRTSYQNRPNIGLSILWALGQGGNRNFNVGFKVFLEFMLPLVELKNYSRYVVNYLLELLKNSDDITLSKEEYVVILETVFSNKKNFPVDLKQELIAIIPTLKPLLFMNKKEQYHVLFEFLLKHIESVDNKTYRDFVCDILVESLKDSSIFKTWDKLYPKYIGPTAILLNYIECNWPRIKKFIIAKILCETMQGFKKHNLETLKKKKKDVKVIAVQDSIDKFSVKMTAEKKSGFSFRRLFFVIALALGAFIYYDINSSGSWKASATFGLIKQSGVCGYSQQVYGKVKEGFSWIDKHIDGVFPGYHEKLADFSEPYIILAKDAGLVVYNLGVNVKEAAAEKYPVVIESIESYAPGLLEQSQKALSSAWSTSVFYVNTSVDYLRHEVFVGQLSPENMQRVVLEALNTTSQKATECYHWIYEKVQTTIK